MTAAHFFVPSIDAAVVRITGEDARHAVRVLRIRPGEPVTLSDGRGSVAQARAAPVAGGELECEVVSRATVPALRPAIELFPAVPKSGKLEWVVQKATEIGVWAIRPWFGVRTVVRWDAAKSAAHAERLRAVALAAAKQSRRGMAPRDRRGRWDRDPSLPDGHPARGIGSFAQRGAAGGRPRPHRPGPRPRGRPLGGGPPPAGAGRRGPRGPRAPDPPGGDRGGRRPGARHVAIRDARVEIGLPGYIPSVGAPHGASRLNPSGDCHPRSVGVTFRRGKGRT